MSEKTYCISLYYISLFITWAGCSRPSPSILHPSAQLKSKEIRFWKIQNGGASTSRIRDIETTLVQCETGLKRFFAIHPRPLIVIAYRNRHDFVNGLQHELGFSPKSAAYFLKNNAPRPMQGKMLVPPDQSSLNICHELVHHYMQSAVDLDRLLAEKWFDEGIADFIATSTIEPKSSQRYAEWFRARHQYLPLYRLQSAEQWSELHADPRLRNIAYLQAESMISTFLAIYGVATFQAIIENARRISIEDAFRAVTAQSIEDFFQRWQDKTRADWSTRFFDAAGDAPSFLPRVTPSAVGLKEEAVKHLVEAAVTKRSDTLMVIKDGKLVVERHFLDARGPIETMSVTKSIVSLAIGLLIAENKLPSINTPMDTWFPEWKGTDKAKITLRHVLTHTSGLDHAVAAGMMMKHADRTRYAQERSLITEPGRQFSYNNEASQLLSQVVQKAAGVPIDQYLNTGLFKPLGIKEWTWEKDQAGNVQTFYGLALSARDLARIGLLLCQDGEYSGRRLISSSWVKESTSPSSSASPMMGYLWWQLYGKLQWVQTRGRRERLEKDGLFLAKHLLRFDERAYQRPEEYWLDVGGFLRKKERETLKGWLAQGKDAPLVQSPTQHLGFKADGWQGQYLAVYPRWNLVVVRQRQPITYTEEENQKYGFENFFNLVQQMMKN